MDRTGLRGMVRDSECMLGIDGEGLGGMVRGSVRYGWGRFGRDCDG